jgi:hypothetical protein
LADKLQYAERASGWRQQMFKVTQNTAHCFSLGEILLMVALNQVEAKAKLDQVLLFPSA